MLDENDDEDAVVDLLLRENNFLNKFFFLGGADGGEGSDASRSCKSDGLNDSSVGTFGNGLASKVDVVEKMDDDREGLVVVVFDVLLVVVAVGCC